MALHFTPIAAEESAKIQLMRPSHRPPAILAANTSLNSDVGYGPGSSGAPKLLPDVPSAARLAIHRYGALEQPGEFSSLAPGSPPAKHDAATSPIRQGDATLVRVAPDPPDVMAIRPRQASPLRVRGPNTISSSTSTRDSPFTSFEAYARRGSLRTPLSISNARLYSQTVGFFGTQLQTPRRAEAASEGTRRLTHHHHSSEPAEPVLYSSWVSRF
jgi:hypothetical protein